MPRRPTVPTPARHADDLPDLVRKIRNHIIIANLPHNEPLTVDEMVKRFYEGKPTKQEHDRRSRKVRSAFALLEREGLLDIRPQSGTFVVRPEPGVVKRKLALRAAIEVHVALQLVERLESASGDEINRSLQALRDSNQKLQELADESDDPDDADHANEAAAALAFRELDREFHLAIFRQARHEEEFAFIDNLRYQTALALSKNMYSSSNRHQIISEHTAIIDALEAMVRHGSQASAKDKRALYNRLDETIYTHMLRSWSRFNERDFSGYSIDPGKKYRRG